MLDALKPEHVNKPYPHVGACDGCRQLQVCNYCGANTARDTGRCTNGRCSECHRTVCTGGSNPHEHNFGKQGT
jgi:hypothetical protein